MDIVDSKRISLLSMRRLASLVIPLDVELSQDLSSDEHSRVPFVLAASGGVKYGNEWSKQLQKTTVATHTTNNALSSLRYSALTVVVVLSHHLVTYSYSTGPVHAESSK